MTLRSIDGLLEIAFKTEGAEALHLMEGSFPEIELDEIRVPLSSSDLKLLTEGQTLTNADVLEHARDITKWLQINPQLEEALLAGRAFSTTFFSPICKKSLNITVEPKEGAVGVTYRLAG